MDLTARLADGDERGLIYLRCLASAYTLRNCCQRYLDAGGTVRHDRAKAELYQCPSDDALFPLVRFDSNIGHPLRLADQSGWSMICYKPAFHRTPALMAQALERLRLIPRSGLLWCPLTTGLLTKSGEVWTYAGHRLADSSGICGHLARLAEGYGSQRVLSAYTPYANTESITSASRHFESLFALPEPLSVTSGIYGTLHVNQAIDYVPEEVEYSERHESRSPRDDEFALICAGYTPHSQEAGKVRRVAHGVSVRIVTRELISSALTAIGSSLHEHGDWLLHCMGQLTALSYASVMRLQAMLYHWTDRGIDVPTLHLFEQTKVASLSVSSGVLVRNAYPHHAADSVVMSQLTRQYTAVPEPLLSMDKLFSTYFLCVPYIASDKPPRTLISAVHALQAISFPFTRGSSIVNPCYSSAPLVRTNLVAAIQTELQSVTQPLPLAVPGTEACVCIANFNQNYEDCIMVSKAAVDRGLFHTQAISLHKLSATETVPAPGGRVLTSEHRWWKASVAGRVLSVTLGKAGDRLVTVERYAPLVTGDKIATQHGQKGVAMLISGADMPWGVANDGQVVFFDMVIAVSSVVNRVTLGQYYELQDGLDIALGRREAVREASMYEVELYDGLTGQAITRVDTATGQVHAVRASYGACRVWQLNHLAYDKRHYTHGQVSGYAAVPPKGRTKGGAIRLGEMELHALASAGLYSCLDELWQRKDAVVVSICTSCNRLIILCDCGQEAETVDTCVQYHAVLSDCIMALASNRSLEYF